MKPSPRTRNRRMDGAGRARKHLAAFQNMIRPEATDDLGRARVLELLKAEAEIHRLLALETQGAVGSPYADADSIAQIHAATKAGEARARATLVVAQ